MKLFLSAAFAALLTTSFPFAVSAQQRGVNASAIDKTAKPGDNFYKYANGAYLAKLTIPADRSSVSTFSVLDDRAQKLVAAIVTDPELQRAPAGSDGRKIADLYRSYMDEAAIEAHGRAALDAQLKPILAINDRHELAVQLGRSLRNDVDALNNTNYHTSNLFGLWVAPSFNDPDHYAPYLLQGGLGLSSRDYYLSDAPRMKQVRDAYGKHLASVFRLLGYENADERATVAAYNTLLREQAVELAAANAAVDARYKAQYGARWQEAREHDMTQLYNFFAQPAAQAQFCAAAKAELAKVAAVAGRDLEPFAVAELPALEAPFWNGGDQLANEPAPAAVVAVSAAVPVAPGLVR